MNKFQDYALYKLTFHLLNQTENYSNEEINRLELAEYENLKDTYNQTLDYLSATVSSKMDPAVYNDTQFILSEFLDMLKKWRNHKKYNFKLRENYSLKNTRKR
jgi:hypothetical protein